MREKLIKFENLKPLIVLTAICLVVAALLAGINMVAAPIIEKAANDKAYAALKVVLPDGSNFEEISLTEDYPSVITKAYKADGGYVFEANVTGNHSGLVIMCGLDADGKIVGVKTIAQEETPSFWSKVSALVDGTSTTYAGKSSADIEAQIVTGATNSSNGIYKAVTAALDAYTVANGGEIEKEPELPTPEDEIIIRAEVLLDAEIGTLINVTPEGTTNVKRVYKDASGKNYAVYTVVISQYGTPETEAVVHITNTGIIKGVKKVTWKVSDPAPDWGYNPPSEERVDQLFKDFKDKTAETIDGVDLNTGATNTATNLLNAMKEALSVVKGLVMLDMPTPEENIISAAEELLGAEAGSLINVTPEETTNIKRIYKDKTGKNYAVYTVVISQYGTPETEAVVHITNTGIIKGVKKITWKVSDAKPEWGYNPPSDDRVNQLFNDFVDKNSEIIDEVDLETGATNTATNLLNAFKESLEVVLELAMHDMPTAEEDVIALAEELLGVNAGTLTKVDIGKTDYVRRVYKDSAGKNFAVYAVVISQYGTPETETLVHINDGVIKGVKKITWRVSDAKPEWGYNPPGDDAVNQLFNAFVDKNAETVDQVEIKTGATNTGANLVSAIKEAVSTVDSILEAEKGNVEESQLPRIVGILILACGIGAVLTFIATKAIIRRKRK